jgi:hypothetical protein
MTYQLQWFIRVNVKKGSRYLSRLIKAKTSIFFVQTHALPAKAKEEGARKCSPKNHKVPFSRIIFLW